MADPGCPTRENNRSRRELNLVVPQRYYVHQRSGFGDRHVYAALTRFIPPQIHGHFERVGPSAAAEAGLVAAVPQGPSNDVSARMRAGWR